MLGRIHTKQVCPKCGVKFPISDGSFPIICNNGCKTQPTKFFVRVVRDDVHFDRKGESIRSFSHAQAVLGEIRGLIDRGKGAWDVQLYRKGSKTVFRAFFESFRVGYKKQIGTYSKLKAVGFHLAYFDEYQMRDITPLMIEDWWRSINDSGLSDRYKIDILTWLKSVFKRAYELAVIDQEPRSWPKVLTRREPEVDQWLSVDEQLTVLSKIKVYDRPIFDFLFLTGVRVNEATGLLRSDVHLKNGTIAIKNTRKRDGSLGIVKNKKHRTVIISSEIGGSLLEAARLSGLNDYQFINRWGRPYSDDYLRSEFRKACVKSGIKPIPLKNGTRHSWGMNQLEAGYDFYSVSKAYGHSSTKMTEHYAKVVDKKMRGMYGRSMVMEIKANGK